MRTQVRFMTALCVVLTMSLNTCLSYAVTADSPPKPNIVFLLADDFGVKDLGCYGSTFFETPNLDRLAAEGVRFTNAYSSHPVCGPSRTAIMSGMSPARLGLVGIGGSIAKVEKSWPEVLKEQGYTNQFIGKWHMGGAASVTQRGFDFNIAGHGTGQPSDYYYPYKSARTRSQNVPDMEDGKPGDYLTDKLTDKALKFLDDHHQKPFLLYFSFYQVHKPAVANVQGREDLVEYFEKKLATWEPASGPMTRKISNGPGEIDESLVQTNVGYAAQVKCMDENIGRVLDKLESLGVADNTIVMFTADQGSMCTSKRMVSSQAPYRMGKGFVHEGGIRAPFIVKWPGQATPGTTNDSVTLNTDIYPTVLDLLGLPLRPRQHVDGVSMKAALLGKQIPFSRTFRWAYPSSHGLGHEPSVSVRKGDYKLIYWFKAGIRELYNVVEDPGEMRNLVAVMPERTEELFAELIAPDYMRRIVGKASRSDVQP